MGNRLRVIGGDPGRYQRFVGPALQLIFPNFELQHRA